MKRLYNSRGKNIANFVNNQLHATSGQNIGHYLEDKDIFIDMGGNYLGEIVDDDVLLYKLNSPYRGTNFGNRGNSGNIGNFGNPGVRGSRGMPAGYRDIDEDKLK